MEKNMQKKHDSMKFIKERSKKAAELRKENLEFQGFEREFFAFQEQLLAEYEKSSGLKHPVNRGDAREDHLKVFLMNNGLIADKFGISKVSSRVVSTTGHHSEEIDILFYDKANSVSLVKYPSVEFYPVEWVHGVIQVKSCLRNKKTILDGLENIASFKRLSKSGTNVIASHNYKIESSVTRGFGILFAYSSTLLWTTMIDAIKEFMSQKPSKEWPNAVVILDQGIIIPLDDHQGVFQTSEIDNLSVVNIMGMPDQGSTLLHFYSMLSEMLEKSQLGGFNLYSYMRLPLVSDDLSYSFSHGSLAEIGTCQKHGQYLRTISKEAIQRILQVCSSTESINWIKATDIAYGKKGDDEEVYARQPGDVLIYNPDNEDFSKILVLENKSLGFDSIVIQGSTYWIPYVYSFRESLIPLECPKCKAIQTKNKSKNEV